MMYKDIEKRFTDLVDFYISKGYRINTQSMAGSQGEIAKVDLTNDKETVRVWLNREYSRRRWEFLADHWNGDAIILRVGVVPYVATSTVWMSDFSTCLDVEVEFYEIDRGKKYYTSDINIALSIQRKRSERWRLRPWEYPDGRVSYLTSDAHKEIATRFLKNKLGYQRVAKDYVGIGRDNETREYRIMYYGEVKAILK